MKNVIYKHPKKIVKIYTYQLKQTTYHLKLEVIIPKNQSKNKHPKKIVKIYTYQLKQTTYHLKLEVIIPKNQSKNKHKIDFVNNNL